MVTVQNCIMAWPLDENNHIETKDHPDGHKNGLSWWDVHDRSVPHPTDMDNLPDGWILNGHGYASLIRAGYGARITYWRNLYAHCRGRCPRPGPWDDSLLDPQGMQLDFTNNVVFAWWGTGAGNDPSTSGNGRYNFVSNYYRGAGGSTDWGERTFFEIRNPDAKGWFSGNRIKLPHDNGPITPQDQYDEDFITYGDPDENEATRSTFEVSGPFESGEYAVPTLPQAPAGAPLGEQSVKRDVGACLKRDQLDLHLLGADGTTGEYKERQGEGPIDNPSEVGGWPTLSTAAPPEDADKDGVPDDREQTTPANRSPEWKNDPRNAQLDDNGDGRTNLEEYLTEIVSESE